MREFLDNRDQYVIPGQVNIVADSYNETARLTAILDALLSRAQQIEESVGFLKDNIEPVGNSINAALTLTENRISYLLSSITSLNKLKAVAPGSAKEVDVKLANLTSGEYANMSYSASDGGIVMSSVNTLLFRENDG